jgi:hypothetical protein
MLGFQVPEAQLKDHERDQDTDNRQQDERNGSPDQGSYGSNHRLFTHRWHDHS